MNDRNSMGNTSVTALLLSFLLGTRKSDVPREVTTNWVLSEERKSTKLK